jgi:heparin/heparan-sulfate lyase
MHKTGFLLLMAVMPLVAAAASAKRTIIYQAHAARINSERAEVVAQDSFAQGRGVTLKSGMPELHPTNGAPPDLVFTIDEPSAGRFVLRTYAAMDEVGAARMKAAKTKFESVYATFKVGAQPPTSRVVFVPWSKPEFCTQVLGIFDLTNGAQEIGFWLPPNLRFERLEVHVYNPPRVPPPAAKYHPPVVPVAKSHPRLWVTTNTLPQVKQNLDHPEHGIYWRAAKKEAAAKIPLDFLHEREIMYRKTLENTAIAKAFLYLVTGKAEEGRAAVRMMREYIARVSYGNLLDITREIGAAIYATACTYDWCYDLTTPEDREIMRRNMLRLAEGMECGWPPFRNSVVNGHGNEMMLNRDLLAMALAVYDEDPLPYQYCAYRLLEELAPLRRFEYDSPRHNQGVSYASYRFGCEMQAAWLLRRMSGRELFHSNIKNLPLYWLNMRLPDGGMLRDGDGTPGGSYYSYSPTALLCYTYGDNALLKGEFQRQGGRVPIPMLYLLLNDPELKGDPDISSLPLTMDFGPILSGMITRTDWNIKSNCNDTVVAEIKGGGYHFGNHQHADAGAIQLYYRGMQVADLGLYAFYGTPYDLGFNKRSVAHSMMLVYDPDEKFLRSDVNDGGTRFIQSHPRTVQETRNKATYHNGRKLACASEPSVQKPTYSFYAVDLKSAYSDKVSAFTRSFCFLHLGSPEHPACAIMLDSVRASNPAFKKYLQFNTLNPPTPLKEGVRLHNSAMGATGMVDVCVLLPRAGGWQREIRSGDAVYDIFGTRVSPPEVRLAERNGHRILFTPTKAQAHDTFLTLLQPYPAGGTPLPCTFSETPDYVTINIADRIVCMARSGQLYSGTVDVSVPTGKERQLILTGMAAGSWKLTTPRGTTTVECPAGNHTMTLKAPTGHYQFSHKVD